MANDTYLIAVLTAIVRALHEQRLEFALAGEQAREVVVDFILAESEFHRAALKEGLHNLHAQCRLSASRLPIFRSAGGDRMW